MVGSTLLISSICQGSEAQQACTSCFVEAGTLMNFCLYVCMYVCCSFCCIFPSSSGEHKNRKGYLFVLLNLARRLLLVLRWSALFNHANPSICLFLLVFFLIVRASAIISVEKNVREEDWQRNQNSVLSFVKNSILSLCVCFELWFAF